MLFLLIYASAFIEAVVEFVSLIIKKTFMWKNAVAFALGIFFAWFLGIDIFAYLEVTPVAPEFVIFIVNLLLFGVLFGRFAGGLNSVYEWVAGLKPKKK